LNTGPHRRCAPEWRGRASPPFPLATGRGAPRDRKIRNNVMIGAIPPNFIPTIHLVSLVLVSAHSAIVSAIPALRLVSTLAI